MPWTHVLDCWPHLLPQLKTDFQHLEMDALRRFRGDRSKMETYLAETHDLTVQEARETLDDWLTYKAASFVNEQAA